MVAQVLAELYNLEAQKTRQVLIAHSFNCALALDRLVLSKLGSYKKPIKTKHLTNILKVDRPSLSLALNRLSKRGLVYWAKPSNILDNPTRRSKTGFGWLVV